MRTCVHPARIACMLGFCNLLAMSVSNAEISQQHQSGFGLCTIMTPHLPTRGPSDRQALTCTCTHTHDNTPGSWPLSSWKSCMGRPVPQWRGLWLWNSQALLQYVGGSLAEPAHSNWKACARSWQALAYQGPPCNQWPPPALATVMVVMTRHSEAAANLAGPIAVGLQLLDSNSHSNPSLARNHCAPPQRLPTQPPAAACTSLSSLCYHCRQQLQALPSCLP